MDTGTRSIPATPGEGTVTRTIKRTEYLLRACHIDETLAVIRELPRSDERRATLLKYWGAHRDELARLLSITP